MSARERGAGLATMSRGPRNPFMGGFRCLRARRDASGLQAARLRTLPRRRGRTARFRAAAPLPPLHQ
jgi:hypothetical protein